MLRRNMIISALNFLFGVGNIVKIKPEDTRRVGRRAYWVAAFRGRRSEVKGIRNCRLKSQDREKWKAIL